MANFRLKHVKIVKNRQKGQNRQKQISKTYETSFIYTIVVIHIYKTLWTTKHQVRVKLYENVIIKNTKIV